MGFPGDYKDRGKEVNEYLMRSLDVIEDKKLKAAMAHYPAAGGKRLRPILATIVCEAVGGKAKSAIPFGAALEIVHNFTLVHDDVMDEDDTRRGIKTVHAQYGVPEAILAGDALFARAFEIAKASRNACSMRTSEGVSLPSVAVTARHDTNAVSRSCLVTSALAISSNITSGPSRRQRSIVPSMTAVASTPLKMGSLAKRRRMASSEGATSPSGVSCFHALQ